MYFCLSNVDDSVCKTKGQALTNPAFLANALTQSHSLPLPLSLTPTHTHTHITAPLLTTTPACASLTSTAHNKSDKLKKKRKARTRQTEGERGRAKCGPLSAGHPLFQPTLVQNTHSQTHTNHTNAGSARETAQVTDDQMKEDAVNLEVDQRGLPPPRIWLSKYQSSLSVSLWHTYSAED